MKRFPKAMSLEAEWTDDCCGKKDYDGTILAISTRYWPRGGGMFVVHNNPGQPVKIEDDSARPEIKPSASCSLLIHYSEDATGGFAIIEKEFEAETLEEIKALVEPWAQEHMDRAVAALKKEFAK